MTKSRKSSAGLDEALKAILVWLNLRENLRYDNRCEVQTLEARTGVCDTVEDKHSVQDALMNLKDTVGSSCIIRQEDAVAVLRFEARGSRRDPRNEGRLSTLDPCTPLADLIV